MGILPDYGSGDLREAYGDSPEADLVAAFINARKANYTDPDPLGHELTKSPFRFQLLTTHIGMTSKELGERLLAAIDRGDAKSVRVICAFRNPYRHNGRVVDVMKEFALVREDPDGRGTTYVTSTD